MQVLNAIIYQVLRLRVKTLLNAVFAIAIFLLISNNPLKGQTSPSLEYQVKAVFLFNFTQFVDWPANSFASGQAPIVIGILGRDPFGSFLDETVSGEKINGRSLQIRRYENVDAIQTCQVLFINLNDTQKTKQVITALKGKNTLTVSDSPGFLQEGGMISFFTKRNKIKLRVNLEAAKTANLVMSSKLLRLVEIYTPH